jgi:alpha-D-ribose 1-methylphosphonate 5-triphosphate synthase subunit PhnI
MDPDSFMHDRKTFRENLLTGANKLSADPMQDSIRMGIVAELEEMVKEIEVLGTPLPIGKLLAEDFDLVNSCSGDKDHDFCKGYELIDPLAEADFGRLC